MINRLYHWVIGLAAHPHAIRWLAFISFIESSVFPIPPHAMLLPMMATRPERAWRYAAVASSFSVAGGWLGYGIGALLYDQFGSKIVAVYHLEAAFAHLKEQFQHYGGWIVLGKGLTPIPFKLVTITSGVLGLDPLIFTASAIASRSFVFFLMAALLRRYGSSILGFIEKRLMLVTSAFLGLVVAGFLVLRWI